MLHSSLSSKKENMNNISIDDRVIDLVFLSTKSLGNKNIEVEILKNFEQRAKKFLKFLPTKKKYNKISQSELLQRLNSLKSAAFGVGARATVNNITKVEQFLRENGYVEPEMLSDIKKSLKDARRFIAKIISG